jgi:uncharacterized membrane protein
VEVPAAGASSAEAQGALRKLAGLVFGLQVAGTWLESDFTWQIRTFWWSLGWCVLGIATAILIVGLIILMASAVWFVYRIVRRLERAQRRPANVRLT